MTDMLFAVLLTISLLVHVSLALDPTYGAQDAYLDHFKGISSSGAFQCLTGSKVIKGDQINDDFCDCPDGSDEPGTSACTNHFTKVKFPDGWKFRCRNIGFKSKEIPHNRVNDGLCDCCDGSDEYGGIVQCANICAEVQEKEAEELMLEREKMKLSLEEKKKMVEQATVKREQDKVALKEEKAELEAAEISRERMSRDLPPLEDHEKKEKQRLSEEFKILQKHIQENEANEEGTKLKYRAGCTKWYTTVDCGTKSSVTDEKGCDELIPGNVSGYCECAEAKTDATVKYQKNCDHKPLRCSFVCKTAGEEGTLSSSEEQYFDTTNDPSYELPGAKNLRAKIKDLDEKMDNLRSSIAAKEARLKRNLNTEDIIRTLEDECFTLDVKVYTYKFCPFKDAHQYSKGTEIGNSIGKWVRFGESTYSLWSTTDDHTHMLYEGGDWCWNHDQRTTDVRLVCGPENKLLKAEEPISCKYAMVFQTPAICE
ncbi:protein kinase C substrate protein, heavy chain, putative [Trypanosoma equiperdum]|uniref:Glucosidase 2 subunit beta n=2 Tax=Trypanozoon TaxID=39700 RepID=Q57VU0_TRYB2|nr:protein kinase C substrate protein, heavy chain, putative [Trypanosoma brucei brucei TREU927]AAX70279.1 protein kinase C substrate protein, heavy chain, putative [Trypanosoma brucei]AAZ12159.1 protein kinase C substrate protein, heavy chain, putative [Trypanosoma brucei brucei TREU927]SCU69352.1 protein kinase C substrate protein, heavy chain, putative [Trypanosoma equiperdum]